MAQVVQASDVRTHSFIVKIDIPAHKGLITGMYGKAFFTIGKREAILIPKSAVVEMSGISGVYLVSPDGNAVFQMVQVGEEHGNSVEVITGLKKGDRVIATNTSAGIDGKKVVCGGKNKLRNADFGLRTERLKDRPRRVPWCSSALVCAICGQRRFKS